MSVRHWRGHPFYFTKPITLVGRVEDIGEPYVESSVVKCTICNKDCWLSEMTASMDFTKVPGTNGKMPPIVCTRCYGVEEKHD